MNNLSLINSLVLLLLLQACTDTAWNNPYPAQERHKKIYYDSFDERPKHLDPVASYVSNEYVFLGQIYEPPLQYHFLKRPYELIPLTAIEVPTPVYFDQLGKVLPAAASATEVSKAVYRIQIKPGIMYQPHPALAKDDSGRYVYHDLSESEFESVHSLADFPSTGTRELTAEDYVYQIKRLVHPKLHSPIAGLMGKYISGLNQLAKELTVMQQKTGDRFLDLRKHELAGARVIDRYSYEIILDEKYPQFIYWLSMYFFSPMPWEADKFYSQAGMSERNLTLDWYPIGSGPFMLTENNPNRRMVLSRNPNFRGEPYPGEGEEQDQQAGLLEDAGKLMPFIDQAIYSLEKESIPSWNKFLQGYYDTSGIVSDSFDQAVQITAQGEAMLTEQMREKDIRMMTAVTTSTYFMGFNMRDEVVGGDSERARLLRRAISIAVDFEEFISIFTNGRGVPAQGPIPPGIFGQIEGAAGINPYVYDWVQDKPRRKSIAEARALLLQAGYENGRDQQTGEPLLLYLDTPAAGPGSKSILDWYRKQFKKLDLHLVIRATDFNRFQEKMLKGTAQIFTWGWNADYPDPENFMFLLYGPNAKVGLNGENGANYANPEFDDLFNQMKSMSNGEQRQQIINRMVEIVRRDAPWLWGYHPVGFSLHHSWYKNSKPNLMANNTLKYKKIDPYSRHAARMQWNRPVWWPIALVLGLLLLSIIPAYITYKQKQKARIT